MAQMTLRLDAVHEHMLERLQSRHPGISRQKLFEHLLEQSVTEDEEHIEDVGRRILDSNPDLWEAVARQVIRQHRFLTLSEVTHLADVATGTSVDIRDLGTLVSALERPRAEIGGRRVYGDLYEQAAALLHAVITTRPFRLEHHESVGLMAALAMLHVNDVRARRPDAEDALRLTGQVGRGLDDVAVIAAHLRRLVDGEPWQDVLPG